MRTGVICYVRTDTENLDLEQVKKDLKKIFKDADLIEIAHSPGSEEDITYGWWEMTRRGMKRILLRFVEIGKDMKIKFTGKEMRLCG
ncbi:hypothetical protein [Desulfothermus sp.]